MKVLSLFDGMGCGYQALKEAGINVTSYKASEIDKYAMQIAKKNYPTIEHIGDVTKINAETVGEIDLLIGGSPCQGFSFAGKQLNFKDPRSALFFEFVRLKNELNPKWFLLENVKMKKEHLDTISFHMGVEPARINTNKFLPINRDRYYWTNIPFNLSLEFRNPLALNSDECFSTIGDSSCRIFKQTEYLGALTRTMHKGIRAAGRPIIAKKSSLNKHIDELRKDVHYRMLTPNECELLQGLPSGYTEGVSKTQRYMMLGNGWTVPVVAEIFKGLKEPTK